MAAERSFPRLFTIDEAHALLPTLRQLMQRISHDLDILKQNSERVIRHEQLSPDSPDLMQRLQTDAEIARLVQEVKGLVEEVESYGCMCKGVEEGLVDFPCLLGGEIVFLCWRYSENGIGYWHRIEDGFAGRRPLLDPDEGEGSGNSTYH